MNKKLKIEIYFGVGKDRDGMALDSARVERAFFDIRYRAALELGGCTLLHSEGDWVSPHSGVIVTEPGAVLVLFVGDTETNFVVSLCEFIKRVLNQESVYMVSSLVEAELL